VKRQGEKTIPFKGGGKTKARQCDRQRTTGHQHHLASRSKKIPTQAGRAKGESTRQGLQKEVGEKEKWVVGDMLAGANYENNTNGGGKMRRREQTQTQRIPG